MRYQGTLILARGNDRSRITDQLRHHPRRQAALRAADTVTGRVRVTGPAAPQAAVRLTRAERRRERKRETHVLYPRKCLS